MNTKCLPKFVSRLLALLLVASGMTFTSFTLVPAAGGYQPSSPLEGRIAASDLKAFTDGLITRQLDESHIPGAVVSIVQGGNIELARGYGFANLEAQIPVTPEATLFRIGSTSKLFTWTAVMQLAEQGKIDLHADINTYLPDFKIPPTFAEPVTMLNLLSHTAGFEERTAGTEAATPEEMLSLHTYLARYMPDRVRPAGELITYSNYGTALAGYIVEVVSGMPFEQYIETHIFEPLDMSHSTFRQPLPPGLESELASSYSYTGAFMPGPFETINLTPAATLCTTGQDMANFMLAHLQEGRFGDRQILKPVTARQMHSHLFSNDERLDGVAYGFFEWNYHGQRILWHSGDMGNWHSGLAILPEQELGFFVGYNSNTGYQAVNEFYYAFMDAFFPAQDPGSRQLTPGAGPDVRDLAGEYRITRSIYNHVERVLAFPGTNSLRVTANSDNTLSIAGLALVQKEPLVFSPQDGSDTYVFHRKESGEVAYLLVNSNQTWSYEPVSWYETAAFNLLLFGICCALLLTAVLAALVAIFWRKAGENTPRLPKIARIWVLLVSVVFLLIPVVIPIYSTVDYKYPFPAYMLVFLALILAASILVTGPVIFTILAWARRYWGLAGRIHYTLITLALLGMVWLVYYWRLLGFRY